MAFMGPFDSPMTLKTNFLPHGRGWLVVWNHRQPVDGIAVMLSAIQCWLRQNSNYLLYLKRISLIFGTIAWFSILFQS